MRFVNIKNGIAFRKIFGNENKKIILLSFLNAVMQLKGKDVLEDVEILNPYQFTSGEKYLSHHAVCDVENGERTILDMDFYFIELPKFTKPLNNLTEITDKWVFFIKEAENLTVIPENVDDEGLEAAYHDANKHSWAKEELEAYDYAAMREQDERGKLIHAEKRGRLEVAKNLKTMGMAPADIKKATQLTDEEIERL